MKEKILKIIFESINVLNEQLPEGEHVDKSIDTTLFGPGSKLDSLGLINLIVAVEQNIEDEYETEITLADEKAMSQEQSPFETVKSLANYIEILLNENY